MCKYFVEKRDTPSVSLELRHLWIRCDTPFASLGKPRDFDRARSFIPKILKDRSRLIQPLNADPPKESTSSAPIRDSDNQHIFYTPIETCRPYRAWIFAQTRCYKHSVPTGLKMEPPTFFIGGVRHFAQERFQI